MTPEPAFPWRDTATLATYRLLLLKGLTSEEASNLTAFLCGIHVGDLSWKLIEVNRLLFLRRLAQSGAWGAFDGATREATLTTDRRIRARSFVSILDTRRIHPLKRRRILLPAPLQDSRRPRSGPAVG